MIFILSMLINLKSVNIEPPSWIISWITHENSLTIKLKAHAGEAHLQVLNQRVRLPTWWDRYVLGIYESVMSREILMRAQQAPCWYARTIVPLSCYHANTRFFNRLQNESLGELVFCNPDIKRVSMNYYAVDSQTIEYQWLKPLMLCEEALLWVRLSAFTINEGCSFYLLETLLPELMRYTN